MVGACELDANTVRLWCSGAAGYATVSGALLVWNMVLYAGAAALAACGCERRLTSALMALRRDRRTQSRAMKV